MYCFIKDSKKIVKGMLVAINVIYISINIVLKFIKKENCRCRHKSQNDSEVSVIVPPLDYKTDVADLD
jgi:ferredoxin-thioredoxin reductase catalytic subunit